jgi:2-hydroxychromene-2-carboxylate isomerase
LPESANLVKAAIARLVTGTLTSPRLRTAQRRVQAWRRSFSGAPAMLHYFHDAADPYSHLTAQMLAAIAARYRAALVPHLVTPPDAAAAPDAARLAAWSRRDAAQLARARGLDMPEIPAPPPAADIASLNAVLTAAIATGTFPETAIAGGAALWRGAAAATLQARPAATPEETAAALAEGDALRAKLRHYLGATFHFEGEWYWGIDRLHHLEARLAAQGLDTQPGAPMLMPARDITLAGPQGAAAGRVLHMFPSFRSPYTYIALPRARALAAHYGAELRLRFVLPMVMRGLPVPGPKRIYIMLDTKREAERLGLPFGKIVDPVGVGVERGLAVLHHAIPAGKGADFALSFLQGAFADGIDATTDAGLHQMAARAGLDAAFVTAALADPSWRATAEANREEMLAAGLWGVPSFRVDAGEMVWGQDRLWVIEEELSKGK